MAHKGTLQNYFGTTELEGDDLWSKQWFPEFISGKSKQTHQNMQKKGAEETQCAWCIVSA